MNKKGLISFEIRPERGSPSLFDSILHHLNSDQSFAYQAQGITFPGQVLDLF